MTDETRDHLRRLVDRRVSRAELREALDAPLSDAEREEILTLKRWFTRRYPTGAERLAYVRRAYARWQRNSRPAP
jgi:hypothetical protein